MVYYRQMILSVNKFTLHFGYVCAFSENKITTNSRYAQRNYNIFTFFHLHMGNNSFFRRYNAPAIDHIFPLKFPNFNIINPPLMPLIKRNHNTPVPMNRKSTHLITTVNASAKCNRLPSPRKSTVEFLRQFARAYNYEPRLKPALGSLIAN